MFLRKGKVLHRRAKLICHFEDDLHPLQKDISIRKEVRKGFKG